MDEASNQQTGEGGGAEESASSQAEIDALMQDGGDTAGESAGTGEQEAGGGTSSEAANAAQGEDAAAGVQSGGVGQDDIDALLDSAEASGLDEGAKEAASQESEASQVESQPDTGVDTLGRAFDATAAEMAAAKAEGGAAVQDAPASSDVSSATGLDTKAFPLADLGGERLADVDSKRVTMLNDVELRVKLQLGKTRMLVEDVLKLTEGSVVELDKLAGDPIDVLINDRLIARGEVLVLNDVFCVRINEVLAHDPHRVTI